MSDELILGDEQHPDTRDYVATNLLEHVDKMPNTGDWHGQLRQWARENSTGKLKPNSGMSAQQERTRV